MSVIDCRQSERAMATKTSGALLSPWHCQASARCYLPTTLHQQNAPIAQPIHVDLLMLLQRLVERHLRSYT